MASGPFYEETSERLTVDIRHHPDEGWVTSKLLLPLSPALKQGAGIPSIDLLCSITESKRNMHQDPGSARLDASDDERCRTCSNSPKGKGIVLLETSSIS